MYAPFPWTKTSGSNSRKKLHCLPLFPHSQAWSHFLTQQLMRRAGYLPPKWSLSPLALLFSSAAVGQKAAGTTVVMPAQLPRGRQSLSVFNKLCNSLKPLRCGCYFLFVTLRSTLYSHKWLCRSMQISPEGTFPLTLLGTEWKWYFHLEDWKELIFVICFGAGTGGRALFHLSNGSMSIWSMYLLGWLLSWCFSDKALNSFYSCNNWSDGAAWDAAKHFQWAQIPYYTILPFGCKNTSLELSCRWHQYEVGYLCLVCSTSEERGASHRALFRDNLPRGILSA